MEKRARKRGIMILSVMSAAGILIGIGCLAALRAAIGRLQPAPARSPQASRLTAPPRLTNTSTLPYGRGNPAPTPTALLYGRGNPAPTPNLFFKLSMMVS